MNSINNDRWVSFRSLMLRDLCLLLNCPPDNLPAVFKLTVPAPLKIGILADLQERYPNTDARRLKRWFKFWVSRAEYLERITKGKLRLRLDLDGLRAGPISEQERKYSQLMVMSAVVLAVRERSTCHSGREYF